MKKILSVVFDDFLADPRAKKFYEALKEDYSVKVVSLCLIDGVRENNITVKSECKNRFVRLFKFWFFVWKQIKKERPDFIIGHNFYVGLPCYLASRFFKIPYMYDAYEFYFPRKKQPFSKRDWFFFLQERVAIKNASIVFAANTERARLMKQAYSLKQRPVSILNIPVYEVSDAVSEKQDFGEDDKVMIIYEGFISFTRFIDKLVDSLEYLPDRFGLTIVGDGADSNLLKEHIRGKSYSRRVHYMGRILNNEILPTISKCNIGFVGYPFTDLNNIYCSPNKIYEYPAAGIPFVSTKQHPIWDITEKYHICDFYDPYDNGAKEIANAIIRVSNNYSYYTRCIKSFNLENNWSKEIVKIKSALKDISK